MDNFTQNFDDLLNSDPANGLPPQLSKEEYAAKKKEEREAIFELSDKTAMEVAGNGATFGQFLDLQARLDRYSAVNSLLVFAQNKDASRLGSFDYWKNLNCNVRPGQTGISILEPHEYTKEDGTPGTGYNIKKVFDVSQVDSRRLRTAPAPSHSEYEIIAALVSKAPVTLTGVDELPDGMGAMTDPETHDIFVLKKMPFADTFQSLARELCYAEASFDHENAPADSRFTAYAASYLLCKKYGIDTKNYDFSSVPEFMDMKDPQEVKKELTHVRDAAESISGRMTRQFEAQQQDKAAKSQDAR